MKASSVSFPAAVLMVIAGMIWGLVMAITRDHSAMPAHAHLNLLGFVVLFLSALYYRVVPEAAVSVVARLQAAIAVVGAVVFPIGIGTVVLYGPARFEPIVVCGAIIVFIGMLLFAFVVFTTSGVKTPASGRALPGTNRTASDAVAGAE